MSKKNIVMLLLSVSTDEELQEMLKEEHWSPDTLECIREEIQKRGGVAV